MLALFEQTTLPLKLDTLILYCFHYSFSLFIHFLFFYFFTFLLLHRSLLHHIGLTMPFMSPIKSKVFATVKDPYCSFDRSTHGCDIAQESQLLYNRNQFIEQLLNKKKEMARVNFFLNMYLEFNLRLVVWF